jgi:starvation-inducible DNA-binding protein
LANVGRDQHTHKPIQAAAEPSPDSVEALSGALNPLLADAYALFFKTKNFHWHVSGPHFRDYHLLFEEQANQIFAMTDLIAERVRMIGGATLRSIGQIGRLQRLKDSDDSFVPAGEMMRQLMEDNRALIGVMREAHRICGEHDDLPTAALLDGWIEEAEKRAWFLFEAGRGAAH